MQDNADGRDESLVRGTVTPVTQECHGSKGRGNGDEGGGDQETTRCLDLVDPVVVSFPEEIGCKDEGKQENQEGTSIKPDVKEGRKRIIGIGIRGRERFQYIP